MLFVELALIRWTGANNVYLAYLTNFVLLASFLGIGVGFLRAGSSRNLLPVAVVGLAVLVVFVLAFPVSLVKLSGQHQLSAALGIGPLPERVSLGIIFLLVVVVMGGIAHTVARTFALFPPLDAYRLDILGSLAGIALFSGLAFLQLPPVAWGTIAVVALAGLLGRSLRWWHLAPLAAIIALLAHESVTPNQYWSPYYKIIAVPHGGNPALQVSVNNVPHQAAYRIDRLRRVEPFYFFAYRHLHHDPLNNVLIVGAGTGNDVAVALSKGTKHIDAVEIDPELQQLGSRFHPNHPYQNPRVSVHINDGRAYLDQTDTHYDLILFALPDTLTLLTGQSSLRLENYLFTIEAMRAARAHLKPGGTFAMYNYYEPFLLGRYAGTLKKAYGSPPCVELGTRLGGRRQAVLTESLHGPAPNCAHYWHGASLPAATDDWPFPYLTSHSIPSFYVKWLALIIGASLIIVRGAGGPFRRMSPYLDLAFMGSAFLLLETKNIVQFALLFGTTWFVNSLVFAGVLLSVLAAIEVASRFRLPRPIVLYAGLAAALAIAWAVPQESLLALSPLPRFLAAAAIAFAPVFLANLIFSQRFRDTASSTAAFAANLLGAIIGGALEYAALVTGYRFLLIVIAGLYALAFLTGRHRPAPKVS
jgi:protein-L-isoaspartate O-methyltransferase